MALLIVWCWLTSGLGLFDWIGLCFTIVVGLVFAYWGFGYLGVWCRCLVDFLVCLIVCVLLVFWVCVVGFWLLVTSFVVC